MASLPAHAGLATAVADIFAEVAELFAKKGGDDVAEAILKKNADEMANLAILKKLNAKPGQYSDELLSIYRQHGTDFPLKKTNAALRKRTIGFTDIGTLDSQTGLTAPPNNEFSEFSFNFLNKNKEELSVGVTDSAKPSGIRILTMTNQIDASKCGQLVARNELYSHVSNVKTHYGNMKKVAIKDTIIEVTNALLKVIPSNIIFIRKDKHLLEINSPSICGISFSVSSKGVKVKIPKKVPTTKQGANTLDVLDKNSEMYEEISFSF